MKDSNVFGRHTDNKTTNRFGWGNTAKAQKVETSIEVWVTHQARLNLVNDRLDLRDDAFKFGDEQMLCRIAGKSKADCFPKCPWSHPDDVKAWIL